MTAVQPVRRRGRRPAGEDARGAIIAAAREEFSERGYDATTLRGIARVAGVDPRLVHHYFESKVDIFVASIDLPIRPQEILPAVVGGGPDEVGERLIRLYLGLMRTPEGGQRMTSILRAVTTSDAVARMLQEFLARELLARIAESLNVPRPYLRASLAASHLIGIAVLRLVVKLEPLASADDEDVVAIVAPTLQRYLTDPDL